MLFIHHSEPRREFSYWLILLTLVFSTGCFHEFYKVQNTPLENFKETVQTGIIQRTDYYVLHHQGVAMHLTNPYFQDGRLHGGLVPLPPDRYRDPKAYKKPVRYRPDEKYILEEVHIFIQDGALYPLQVGNYFVPDSAIAEIHVYDKAAAATSASYLASVLGITTSLVGTAAIMTGSAKSSIGPSFNIPSGGNSCPFIYAYNGRTFQLQGEAFAGAIFPQLERHDYLSLPKLTPVDHGYQIRITNEQPEFHHINLANLVVVEHPENSKVLLDRTGKAFTFVDPQKPLRAEAPNGKDLLPIVSEKDFNVYYYEEGDVLQNHVVLGFAKPAGASTAKLLLQARSSYWSTIMFSAMTEMLGDTYPQWVAQMSELPLHNMQQMMDDQGLLLGIYIWTEGDWQLIDHIENVGPIAFRDLIIPIDLSQHAEDEVRIKVEGGHLFWEMDYAAMDFTEDLSIGYEELQPGYAIASDKKVYTQELSEDDGQYLDLASGGQQVTLWYPASPARTGYTKSTFLHSKGYYEHLRNYEGAPRMADFPALDQAGTFIQFSKDRFAAYLKAQAQLK